jgi:uncharacterized protein (TIGR02266 family)
VRIDVDCTTHGMFVSNRVSNISRGGVFIESDKPLPIDAEVQLTLALPESRREVHAVGRVIWYYDMRRVTAQLVPGMGIKFMDMSAEDRALLEDYVDRLTSLVQPLAEAENPPRSA